MKDNFLHSFDEALKQSFEDFLAIGLGEDLGEEEKDITTEALFSPMSSSKIPVIVAEIRAKENLIVCGLPFLSITFAHAKELKWFKKEGDSAKAGECLARVIIDAKEFLLKERVTLNIIQRLSGIATKTHQIVKILSPEVMLLDTRKTIPGYRLLEKYAVKVGGGQNHRMGLFDEYMVKDNHISAFSQQQPDALMTIIQKISLDRKKYWQEEKKWRTIIVECKNTREVELCLAAYTQKYLNENDVILLDNMHLDSLKKSIKIIKKCLKIEISGGINQKSIAKINDLVQKGFLIDRISSGAITHHANASDIHFKITKIFPS